MLDTGPAFDFFFDRRGVRNRAMEHRARGVRLGIGLPTLAEVLGGIELSKSRDHSWAVVHRSFSKLVFWPFDRAAAYEYGRLYARLRKAGLIIQHNDIQNAAIALTLGECTFVSYDSDHTRVPGLRVENWSIS